MSSRFEGVERITSSRFERVEPGDVITSELMNYMLTKIREMEERIAEIESQPEANTRLTIIEFDPGDQQAIGRILEIRGRNFLFPAAQNTVTIGGVRVTDFRPSTTTFLRFVVPALSGAPKNVDITVENSNGKVTRAYRVTAAVPVTGPAPIIETIRTAGGSAILRVGQPFIISGENFSPQAGNNVISLRSRVQGFENEVYQVTSIDTEQSSQRSIRATLPNGIVIHDPENGDLMQISLTVGAHNPVEKGTTVRPATS